MRINIPQLRKIAKETVQKEVTDEIELAEFLGGWFSKRYNLPDNHPLFLEKTLEELVIDYYKDQFLSGKEALVTEEEKSDEYEKELEEVMGDEYHTKPDYLYPPSPEELAKAIALQKKGEKVEEFEEEYPIFGEDVTHIIDED